MNSHTRLRESILKIFTSTFPFWNLTIARAYKTHVHFEIYVIIMRMYRLDHPWTGVSFAGCWCQPSSVCVARSRAKATRKVRAYIYVLLLSSIVFLNFIFRLFLLLFWWLWIFFFFYCLLFWVLNGCCEFRDRVFVVCFVLHFKRLINLPKNFIHNFNNLIFQKLIGCCCRCETLEISLISCGNSVKRKSQRSFPLI